MASVKQLLGSLEGLFSRKQKQERAKDPPRSLLTFDERERYEAAVQAMLDVAEIMGLPGWQRITEELASDKARLAEDILVRMKLEQFTGSDAVEARGRYQQMELLGDLAERIVARGAAAQHRLNEDAALRRPKPVQILRV
jgi:hypothetical protein